MLRRLPNHEEVAGVILFTHLFQQCPEAKELFGFPIEMDPGSDQMQTSKRFLKHAAYMIQMLDRAFNMLGPDAELLAEILGDLGKKHARMGVKEEMFPVMGEALIATMKEVLAENFTPDVEAAYKEVYNALATGIVKSMNSEKLVLDSWSNLKKIPNYDEKAGVLLFQSLFRKSPEAKTLFGFPIDMDVESETLLKSRRFTMHAKYFIEMLDKALSMVEAKCVEENMKALGAMHAEYGVKAAFFPTMGEALVYSLSETLKNEWNDELQAAWESLFDRLSSQMIVAMRQKK